MRGPRAWPRSRGTLDRQLWCCRSSGNNVATPRYFVSYGGQSLVRLLARIVAPALPPLGSPCRSRIADLRHFREASKTLESAW